MSFLDACTPSAISRLPIDDGNARARSALRLGDLQAAASHPRLTPADGGEVRALAVWDFYFIEEACRRLPRSQGLCHLHNGWNGLDTARFQPRGNHKSVSFRECGDVSPSPEAIRDFVGRQVASVDPSWTIVLTRVVNEVPDPVSLMHQALLTRRAGAGVIITAMASEHPYVWNDELRLGLLDAGTIAAWAERTALLLAGAESAEYSTDWPHHIILGLAYANH